jgi:2,4-dienoyl-CoA reductase-like NADH-dependent reductase (Old Yellow Enzyme family)
VADIVHEHGDGCKIVAQIGAEMMGLIGSNYPGRNDNKRVVDIAELPVLVEHFATQINRLKAAGFDGVQIHGAHGYFFNSLLSPYANNRDDAYGGPLENRVRIIREIVDAARDLVGDYPILIKAGCDDFVDGGYDADSFPKLAEALVACGIDAIELSKGMNPNDMDYGSKRNEVPFEPHARNLDVPIPTILVDSIRDVEKAEELVSTGVVDFVSMCKPFINEPDLPNRWQTGAGSSKSGCVDCGCCSLSNYGQYGILNACIYKDYPDIYREMNGSK